MLITHAPQFSGPRPLSLFVAATAVLFTISSMSGEEPAEQSNSPQRRKTKLVVKQEQVDQWVGDLKHDDYEVRERAQRRLQKVGRAAIRPLLAGVQSADPEVSWRCGEILQYLSLHGDDATIMALLDATAKAAETSQHTGLQAFANDMTYRRRERRHSAVKSRLQSLGAQVFDAHEFVAELAAIEVDAPFLLPEEAIEVEDDAEMAVDVPPDEGIDDLDAGPAIPDEPIPADADPFGGDPVKEAVEEPVVEEPTVEEPATPEAPTVEEAPIEPELAKPIDDPDDEDIEVETEEEPKGVDVGEVLEDFDLLKKEGIERAEAEKREIFVGDADVIPAPRLILGGFGVVPGLGAVQSGGPGQIIVDTGFHGRDRDLKDVKDLLGITKVQLGSARLSDKSLEHVARMPELARLELAGGAYTSAGMRAFRKARPEIAFFARGVAVLGITGDTSGGPCRIDAINVGSGAAEAGLQPGDEIVEVEGQTIETFADLTVEVYPHKPDEEIKIVYLRDGKRNEATIRLRARPPGQ